MQKVLSSDLWKTVRAHARKAPHRKAAIAYVTQDLVGFRRDDVLVVNASKRAIASGETDAKLLRALKNKGVRIFDCANLHAKALLLGETAVISSGNMSNSSADGLVEAGVITNNTSTVSGIASLIEQIVRQSKELTDNNIATLCKIKVVRRGGHASAGRKRTKVSRLGNRTWLVGVKELRNDPPEVEQQMIDKAIGILSSRELMDPDDDPNWIRWTGRGRFIRECREGDSLIQIWCSSTAKRPSAVMRSVPVLLKQKTKHWTRLYPGEATGSYAEMTWGKFKRLLEEVGYKRKVGAGSVQLLDPAVADEIGKKWKSASK